MAVAHFQGGYSVGKLLCMGGLQRHLWQIVEKGRCKICRIPTHFGHKLVHFKKKCSFLTLKWGSKFPTLGAGMLKKALIIGANLFKTHPQGSHIYRWPNKNMGVTPPWVNCRNTLKLGRHVLPAIKITWNFLSTANVAWNFWKIDP